MQKISISKNALRILSLSIEANPKGFTRKELKQVDKVIIEVLDPFIAEYNDKIKQLIDEAKKNLAMPNAKKEEINSEVNDEVNELTKTEGKEIIEVKLEDADFDFVKAQWEKQDSFSGQKDARKLILEIENSIEKAVKVENSPKEQEKKTEPATDTSKIEEGKN